MTDVVVADVVAIVVSWGESSSACHNTPTTIAASLDANVADQEALSSAAVDDSLIDLIANNATGVSSD